MEWRGNIPLPSLFNITSKLWSASKGPRLCFWHAPFWFLLGTRRTWTRPDHRCIWGGRCGMEYWPTVGLLCLLLPLRKQSDVTMLAQAYCRCYFPDRIPLSLLHGLHTQGSGKLSCFSVTFDHVFLSTWVPSISHSCLKGSPPLFSTVFLCPEQLPYFPRCQGKGASC